jgi:hypothetical protein
MYRAHFSSSTRPSKHFAKFMTVSVVFFARPPYNPYHIPERLILAKREKAVARIEPKTFR